MENYGLFCSMICHFIDQESATKRLAASGFGLFFKNSKKVKLRLITVQTCSVVQWRHCSNILNKLHRETGYEETRVALGGVV